MRDNQCEGYEVGDHKLIFKNTYDDEENGKPKKYTINAKSARAPDVFFYVHIDVDLDAVPRDNKNLLSSTRDTKRKIAKLKNRRKNVKSKTS